MIFQDIIYNVKKAFNSEFDAAYKQKEIEIARVKERNVRIEEIITDLELEEKVWQPVFEDCEKPERALVVEDDEVQASHLIPSCVLGDLTSSGLPILLSALVLEAAVQKTDAGGLAAAVEKNSQDDLNVKPRESRGPSVQKTVFSRSSCLCSLTPSGNPTLCLFY